jgi:cbb3-type cytochrome oxidase subunit 3
MSAAAWGTVAAIVFSVVSLYYARRADQRAARAEERAERAEHRASQADERAAAADERSRRANLVVLPGGHNQQGAGPLVYFIAVRNTGPAVARDVQVWLRDEKGQDVSTMGRRSLRSPGPAGDIRS